MSSLVKRQNGASEIPHGFKGLRHSRIIQNAHLCILGGSGIVESIGYCMNTCRNISTGGVVVRFYTLELADIPVVVGVLEK